MGRSRRYPLKDGRIVSESKIGMQPGQIHPNRVADDIDHRAGNGGVVCYKCSHCQPASRDSCRKCGHGNLRPAAKEFRGDTEDGANV